MTTCREVGICSDIKPKRLLPSFAIKRKSQGVLLGKGNTYRNPCEYVPGLHVDESFYGRVQQSTDSADNWFRQEFLSTEFGHACHICKNLAKTF